jgi:ATP-dependent DNA ligase
LDLWDALNGRDLEALPLLKRQQRLARVIWRTTLIFSRVLVVEEDGRALFSAVHRLDLEGIVAKRKANPYSPGEGRWELFQKRRP